MLYLVRGWLVGSRLVRVRFIGCRGVIRGRTVRGWSGWSVGAGHSHGQVGGEGYNL